jgi:uroporphyrinogen-III synthase
VSALGGRRVLVTRRGEQSRPLVDALARRGATVVEVPLVAYEPPEDPRPLDGALDRLPSYDWIAFTSANAVGAVADRLAQRGLELPLRVRLAAVGAATADAIAARFPSRRAELQPEAVFRAEGLVAAFGALPTAPRRVLLPVSDRARDTLAAGLRALGAQADVVVAYRTLAAAGAREGLERALADGVDLVLLASPSAVEALQQALGERARGLPAAVIGPVTEACARDAGLDVKVVARSATADDLAAAAERCFAEPSRSG